LDGDTSALRPAGGIRAILNVERVGVPVLARLGRPAEFCRSTIKSQERISGLI